VKLYDGANAQTNLLLQATGTTLPSTMISSGGFMYIEFQTNSLSQSSGFDLTYTTYTYGLAVDSFSLCGLCCSDVAVSAAAGIPMLSAGDSVSASIESATWFFGTLAPASSSSSSVTITVTSSVSTLGIYLR
jgi:hypothetical protein